MVTPQEQWYVSTKSVIGLFPVLLHSPEILFIISYFNPFAPGDFAEKRVLKLVEWFSGHCRAIKS